MLGRAARRRYSRRGLIAAEDEPLLHALTTPQLRSTSDRRLRQEGVSAAAAERGVAAIIDGEHASALVADWLGERPNIDRDRALAELARCYLVGHGPADARDLAKWAQLPLLDAHAGLAAIASEITERPDGLVDVHRDEVPLLLPPRLLGAFDPLLLGWR